MKLESVCWSKMRYRKILNWDNIIDQNNTLWSAETHAVGALPLVLAIPETRTLVLISSGWSLAQIFRSHKIKPPTVPTIWRPHKTVDIDWGWSLSVSSNTSNLNSTNSLCKCPSPPSFFWTQLLCLQLQPVGFWLTTSWQPDCTSFGIASGNPERRWTTSNRLLSLDPRTQLVNIYLSTVYLPNLLKCYRNRSWNLYHKHP